MHILLVSFFNLFVFHLQVDIFDPLLLNASLVLVLTTDYSIDYCMSLNLVTNDNDRVCLDLMTA